MKVAKAGDWGIFSLNFLESVHPDDRANVPRGYDPATGRWNKDFPGIFKLESVEGDYLILKAGNLQFRGKADAFKPLAVCPVFEIGDSVSINQTLERGIVRRIDWHFKRQVFVYLLSKNGRRSDAWYQAEELTRQETAP